MPVDPHTWDGEFLSATLLDNDFYQFAGSAIIPTGINFHINRPLYKSYNKSGTTVNIANSAWGLAYASTSSGGGSPESGVIVDSGGQFGGWFDPNLTGNVRYNTLLGGGGNATTAGGLALMAGYVLWPASGGGSNVGAAVGLYSAVAPASDNQGTLQATNTNHQTTCMCIDLIDAATQRWGLFGYNGTGAALAPALTSQVDGSGWGSRLHALWVSVYTGNGFQVTNLPNPVGYWSLTSPQLTSALLNGQTGFRGPLRCLNMPPLARAEQASSQALVANTITTINLAATSGMVTYSSFASNTFTAPLAGLYFVHGYLTCQNFSGTLKAGVNINGTNYWGPVSIMPGSGEASATKTQVFLLNAGDTITLKGLATAATNTSTAHVPRLVVTWLGSGNTPAVGSGGGLPIESDTTFRFTAGTPGTGGTNAANMTAFPANDLNLLINRPYAMAYQTVAQSITAGTDTAMNLDTVKDIIRGGATDNFGGWSSVNNNYVAPVSGWYLCVEEHFLASPSLTATPSVLALYKTNPHGLDGWDRYQQQAMITGAAGSGATGVSYYYLRKGDTITPGIATYDSSSTTINTTVAAFNSHFEVVFLGQ